MKLPLTHTNRTGAALAVALPLALLVAASLPPFVSEGVGSALMYAFAPACHQIPERSFAVGGVPLALCHRCVGVVLGLALGAVLLLGYLAGGGEAGEERRGGVALLLVVAFAPMGVDWGLNALGWWANTPVSRTATGLWAGVGLGLLMAHALTRPPRPRRDPEEVVGLA